MRWILAAVMLVGAACGAAAWGQEPVATIRTGTSLVLVPVSVRTKAGEPVFTLTVDDFVVTDDGVVQKIRLEEDADLQPLALVIVLEAGSTAEGKFADYAGLRKLMDALVGGTEHKVAVVGFDSVPEVVQGWTADLDNAGDAVGRIETGDGGAASLDALTMAVGMLREQPRTYRRAILLVGETVDRGSHAKAQAALRAVSDTNTVIYSLGYSSTRATNKHELAQTFGSVNGGRVPGSEAPPPHGCMGKYADVDLEGNPLEPPANPKGQGSHANNKVIQAYDCLSLLAPPLRLAKMAVLTTMNGLKTNIPETAAKVTGGEYFKAENAKALEKDLLAISNRLPNRYFLSFTPSKSHPGLHAIEVQVRPERVGVEVRARSGYWEAEAGK